MNLIPVLILSFFVPLSINSENVTLPQVKQEVIIKKTVVPDILKIIAKCESPYGQFYDDGTLVRGKINHQDVGKYQLNEKYHLQTAKSMGIDIYTEEGNEKYALWLYKHEGTTPWNASKSCWDEKSVNQVP